MLNRLDLPLAPRFVRDLLHGRQQIFQNAAGSEMDFGVDQHDGAFFHTEKTGLGWTVILLVFRFVARHTLTLQPLLPWTKIVGG